MKDESQNPFAESELTTILVVSDMPKSKKFYVEALGAELNREYGGTSMVINFLGSWILLVTAGGPTEDKPDIYFEPPVNKKMVNHSFTIRVKDCHLTYEVLKEKGIAFITPPITNGAETRCFFHDPDGHLFEISEYSPTS
jgi:catechol 2,3-dioxygenase-like lactoylglutathione lyase family enzyme